MSIQYTDNITVFSGTGTATSDWYDVSKRQQITFQLSATETTVFSFDASNDGVNAIVGIAFLDAKATAVTTYVTSKSVTVAANEGAYIPSGFRFIRVVAAPNGGVASATMEAGG